MNQILENNTMVEAFVETSVAIQTTEVEILVFDTGELEVNFVYPVKGDPGDLQLDPSLSDSNYSVDGLRIQLEAAETMAFGTVCYMDSLGRMAKASANTASTSRAVAISAEPLIAGATGEFLLTGFVRNDIWDWTAGEALFLSQTPGELTHSPPTAVDSIVQVLGVSIHEDRVYFNPSPDILTHA